MHEEKSEPTRSTAQIVGLILGAVLFFIIILFFDFDPEKPIVTRMAAVAILMAVWWITDAIPLFATALLPIVLYPLLGILGGKATAPIYINSTIFLFMGGFMIALTMEKWQLHRRIALFIIRLVGGGPSRIVLGFMAAAAFLSMWISNTATAIMMVPIGLAIISQMEEKFDEKKTHKFTVALMLGIAYACSLGGVATLVGTPPNLSFARIFQITFPKATPIAFGTWFMMGLPVSIVMIVIVWLVLTKIYFRVPADVTVDRSIVDKEYKELGAMSFEEKSVLVIFFSTAFLWVFRKTLNLGFVSIPGWSQLIPYPKLIDDGTVALVMAMILFLIPTRSKDAQTATIMGPDVIKNIPWNIVILFGGGFALAKGFQVTGLATLIGNEFAGLAGMNPIIMVLIVCFGLTFLNGANIQYRDHGNGPPDFSIRGLCYEGEPALSDDPGHPFRILCLHDAGGNAAQCDCLRQRADQNRRDGQSGRRYQHHRRYRHYGHVLFHRNSGVQYRPRRVPRMGSSNGDRSA